MNKEVEEILSSQKPPFLKNRVPVKVKIFTLKI